jgi:hypothetical protein
VVHDLPANNVHEAVARGLVVFVENMVHVLKRLLHIGFP